jgi:hypothetical protein
MSNVVDKGKVGRGNGQGGRIRRKGERHKGKWTREEGGRVKRVKREMRTENKEE